MKTNEVSPSSKLLAAVNPAGMAHYQKMRAAVMPPPSVPPAIAEMMLAMQLVVLELEVPFKVHAMRAMNLNVTLEQLQGLVLAGVSVSLLAAQTGQALRWIDEACEEMRQAGTGTASP